MFYVLSSVVIISLGKRERERERERDRERERNRGRDSCCFTLNVYMLPCGCLRSVSLSRGTSCLSATCDHGISWSYSLLLRH